MKAVQVFGNGVDVVAGKNSNLHAAKKAKNDEFYTMLTDIEREMIHYREHFRDKVIFLNCDDDNKSNFWKFFKLNMDFLGIKKLISTHYDEKKPTHKVELVRKEDNLITEVVTKLSGNGDFRSPECVAILDECDIVITNPPFSLFREFIDLLVTKNKKFLVVGSLNAITYKEIFPLIKDNKLWLGVNNGAKTYKVPDAFEGKHDVVNGEKYVTLGNTGWFTNLTHHIRNTEIHLFERYTEDKYPRYDNYDAIDISRVSEIPLDYKGNMGVPITFLTKYNPDQFEILWQASGNTRACASKETLEYLGYERHEEDRGGCGVVSNKRVYSRILIKRK